MNAKPALHEIAYVSTLAPDQAITVVAEIARQARLYNTAHEITGLMIFDGVRFSQQLEGQQKKVLKLAEKISLDLRHRNVQIFYDGPLAERRFKNFSLAFMQAEGSELSVLEGLDGRAAMTAFLALLPALDMGF